MADSLPVEITTDIISWLPPKSIATCTAVCKSWNSLIKSSAFVRHHLSRTIQSYRQNNVHILLIREGDKVFSLYGNNNYSALADDQYVELPLPPAYVDNKRQPFYNFYSLGLRLSVAGTCNGVICLAAGVDLSRDSSIIIWNPTVQKYVISPMPSITASFGSRKIHAFGHDLRNNDYKVLRILTDHERVAEPFRAEIYSLARGSWRSLAAGSVPSHSRLSSESSFINGASHWIQGSEKYGKNGEDEEYMIVLFDMATELFGEMQMPEALRIRRSQHFSSYYITNYEECLALIKTGNQLQMGLKFLQVWVMKEYGVVESWTRLYMISDLVSIPRPPFGFKSSCELIVQLGIYYFKDYIQPMHVFNFDDGRVKVFSHYISRHLQYYPPYLSMNSFVESLVLLDQPDAISY